MHIYKLKRRARQEYRAQFLSAIKSPKKATNSKNAMRMCRKLGIFFEYLFMSLLLQIILILPAGYKSLPHELTNLKKAPLGESTSSFLTSHYIPQRLWSAASSLKFSRIRTLSFAQILSGKLLCKLADGLGQASVTKWL